MTPFKRTRRLSHLTARDFFRLGARRLSAALALYGSILFGAGCDGKHPVPPTSPAPSTALAYLKSVMDRYHVAFDVYTDSHAAGNHFVARGRMSSPGAADRVPAMNEACTVQPYRGLNCIEARFTGRDLDWGGWYFMNGVLQGLERAPQPNWGETPGAGVDLSGATRLSFWARGARGGEWVKFFALGVGRDAISGQPVAPYPDSSPLRTTGYVQLSSEWQEYSIGLQGADLGYVLGGFGWATNAEVNDSTDVTFYLDDIRYDQPRLGEPRFLVSYETIPSSESFDVVMRNVAFTYDNAVALLAFLAAGEPERARQVADALVAAQNHDRFYSDNRVRSAYQGGDLLVPPGWTPNGRAGTVRMPGWYDPAAGQWYEDEFQVSTHTGNVAWAMLALLGAYGELKDPRYLEAARRLGEWVEAQCRDSRGAGGYTGGFEGWEPAPRKLLYKATEHNLDLYAAFQRLYVELGDAQWQGHADHAKQFVEAMWDSVGGKFWTGTLDDGVTINQSTVPLDIQAWAILALRDEQTRYPRALAFAEQHHAVRGGFDFNEDRDGIWYEGTAQMAAAYQATGQSGKQRALLSLLQQAQLGSGGLPATDVERLTTGFSLPDGSPWLYYRRAHVGATAWYLLANLGRNPFWYGTGKE